MSPNVLTPVTSKALNQPLSTPATQVGLTWAGTGLNIDLDNIMGGKSNKSGPAPSMNQLASNSPQHHAKPMGELYFNIFILLIFNYLFTLLKISENYLFNYKILQNKCQNHKSYVYKRKKN